MKQTKGKTIRACFAAILLWGIVGCSANEDTSGQCSDPECYGVCLGNAWADLTEDYWNFEAYCINGNTCNCYNSCDEARCDKFCVTEKSMTGGTCDWLDCVCYGPIGDAGPDASE